MEAILTAVSTPTQIVKVVLRGLSSDEITHRKCLGVLFTGAQGPCEAFASNGRPASAGFSVGIMRTLVDFGLLKDAASRRPCRSTTSQTLAPLGSDRRSKGAPAAEAPRSIERSSYFELLGVMQMQRDVRYTANKPINIDV